jgi:putative ABC transport system ATP-binding protein
MRLRRTATMEEPIDEAGSTHIAEVRGASHLFRQGRNEIWALREVDLAVSPGEFLAITGPSGSGKSTLLHVLGGILRPGEGEVRLEGRPTSTMSDAELTLYRRRRMGFIFQFFHLLPTMNALENVAVPLMLDGAPDAFDRARAALGDVGLADRADHRPAELSGGEQQRVAVARAVVTRPALVCADEPTGNLDTVTGEDVLGLLRKVADGGQTVVMVTHEARVAAFADRVVRLVDGELVGPEETGD